MSRHLVIVGGGAIGLSIAWQAASQQCKVTLIDRGRLGGEATWASAGLLPYVNPQIVRHPLEMLAAASHALHAQWYPIIRSQSGVDYEYEAVGTIHVARSRAEKASLIGLAQRCEDEQIPHRRLSREELLFELPTLGNSSQEAHEFQGIKLLADAQLTPPKFVTALEGACRQLGVQIIENVGDVHFSTTHSTVTAAKFNRTDQVRGDDFVVACGAWSSELLQPIGVAIKFLPIRGQIAYFKLDRRPFSPCVYEGGNYLVSRQDGGLLAGSTIEEVGFDKSTTPEAIESLAKFAGEIVPEVAGRKPDRAWAGLRPATFDGFPYIGRTKSLENLFVAAGHFRAGIHLAPITAQIICDLLHGDLAAIDATPFRLARG